MHDIKASINRMAEIMLNRQKETNKRFELLMDADHANTTMIIEAFREEAGAMRHRLGKIENRLAGLETK